MSAAVDIRDVVKRYGDHVAVDHVSLNIPSGTIYGILGPNGAGKSSTIRMIMRITLPDEGTIEVLGEALDAIELSRIGYLPEERGLYKKMKVAELITFFAEIKGVPRAEAKTRTAAWLERIGLADYADKPAEDLSKGMQQKVQFVITMIHEPDILILDEPFSGLDPVNTNVLKDIILEYNARGHTVILSTHMMDQVEKMCREICLINRGRVVLEGSLADVKSRYGRGGVTLRFQGGDGRFLAELPEVESVSDWGNETFFRLRDGVDPQRLLDAARTRLTVTRYEIAEPSIHDIFVEQVQAP